MNNTIPSEQQIVIREMIISDYESVCALWARTEYLSLNECDTREGIELYLKRNPGLCFIAVNDISVIGSVLCGHDGRRGFLRHLAVEKTFRKRGIASQLIAASLRGLGEQGIGKCNIFVEDSNAPGMAFWTRAKWKKLVYDFSMLQISIENIPLTPHPQRTAPAPCD